MAGIPAWAWPKITKKIAQKVAQNRILWVQTTERPVCFASNLRIEMNPYLLPGLELSPALLRRLLERIPESEWDTPTDPGRFTFREAVAHLADWEPILRDERLRTALEQPGGTFPVYDESDRAIEKSYASQDPWEALAEFERERAKTVEFVRTIPREAYANRVIHPERGEMMLADVANMLIGHDLFHLEHFSQGLR
jgi:hypothetical protein